MTSAERKAAEASAPPVQTGYFDPNNPGVRLPPQFHDMPILKLQLHMLFTFKKLSSGKRTFFKSAEQARPMFHPLPTTTTHPRATQTQGARKTTKKLKWIIQRLNPICICVILLLYVGPGQNDL